MSTPALNEPIAPEAAVDQDLEAGSTTEPDAGEDTEPHNVLVGRRSARKNNSKH